MCSLFFTVLLKLCIKLCIACYNIKRKIECITTSNYFFVPQRVRERDLINSTKSTRPIKQIISRYASRRNLTVQLYDNN